MAMEVPQTLVVPLTAGPRTNYKRDTKKPDSKKSILELFFDAQYAIQGGEQPPIIIQNGYLIEHLGQRLRAPTTWETIQDGINTKSDVHKRAEQIENGDFSDDEEDDDDLSSMQYGNGGTGSPRSEHRNGRTPPPPPSPYDNDDQSQSQTFSSHTQTQTPTGTGTATATSNSMYSPRSFAKPAPKGRARGKRKPRKVSLDEHDPSISSTGGIAALRNNNSGSGSDNDDNNNNNNINNDNNNGKHKYQKIENSVSGTNNHNSHNINNNSNNTQNGKEQQVRGKRNGHSQKAAVANVCDLWFKAQAQLALGKQPHICKKAGIQLSNVRIHVKKYANHAKRNSRVSPQDFLNVYISKPRKSIAADDDEDDDLTDNELSTSKSAGPDNSPITTPT